MSDPRRSLPAVERLLQDPAIAGLLEELPRRAVLAAVRAVLADARARGGLPADWALAVTRAARESVQPSLRRVVNATGVVLHTNLGRAPLAEAARRAVAEVSGGYATVEFDLETGLRGSRHRHCGALLAGLAGTEAAAVVNNAAGALVLALQALAGGREVLLSRGELIEIGGSFRIPDILAASGAILREVGTTNRTHLADYAEACSDRTAAILTVHRSNFEQLGFVSSPAPAELAALARARGIPYIHDVGSGLLMDLEPWGLRGEPRVAEAVAAGAGLVIFSGDKLLGGPQAGCLVGEAGPVERCLRSPLARALRADKQTLAALEATLHLYQDPARARREIPVLRMLTTDPGTLHARAQALREALAGGPGASFAPVLLPGESTPGGGSFPAAVLPTTLVALDPGALGADALAARLREADPPVIARVADGRVLLDPRTVDEADLGTVALAVGGAAGPDPS